MGSESINDVVSSVLTSECNEIVRDIKLVYDLADTDYINFTRSNTTEVLLDIVLSVIPESI